ncbi:probable protein phosphatase 2C 60 [Phalaenopsis equestris]|uniref:probable protein phosphatase 2C 60 n=1 Tax=Phalaenopsis equestris TaxID=78828 RepID=UPI0009E36076|nr:probable protein phosphatase 2C 60 [Phalaenopsis equestris]
MKIVSHCLKIAAGDKADDGLSLSRSDGLLWYKDVGKHSAGEFSMAVVQANYQMEDGCQIESGSLSSDEDVDAMNGTFVGIYDGHGGAEAARFITANLFLNLKEIVSEHKGISVDVLRKAFSTTEEGFLSLVREKWKRLPQLASVGSCCLIGVIFAGTLYVANVGDSRLVLGRLGGDGRGTIAVQMTTDHNVSDEAVRNELMSLHPHDSQIVVLKHNVWRVKGLIQISRSIGDAYLKDSQFNQEPLLAKFRLPQPFYKPVLSSDPSIITHKLSPREQFMIFASDGLWEHLSNQEAVDIVRFNPRAGIARRLIKHALMVAAKKREMRYSDLKKIGRGIRRHFHDDISVIVIFFDHLLITAAKCSFFLPEAPLIL